MADRMSVFDQKPPVLLCILRRKNEIALSDYGRGSWLFLQSAGVRAVLSRKTDFA